jgi:hypothetical protein
MTTDLVPYKFSYMPLQVNIVFVIAYLSAVYAPKRIEYHSFRAGRQVVLIDILK